MAAKLKDWLGTFSAVFLAVLAAGALLLVNARTVARWEAKAERLTQEISERISAIWRAEDERQEVNHARVLKTTLDYANSIDRSAPLGAERNDLQRARQDAANALARFMEENPGADLNKLWGQ